ncbi:MAG: PEP/pyruvate-binding domain-containing protein [Halioglobus sp.]|nr:PEP/pyruvate-binding domain-containing protein [Halioglobus sp.]
MPIVEKALGAKAHEDGLCRGAQAPHPELVRHQRRPSAQRSCCSDDEILQLARWACVIEEHYGQAMDMEWGKDGETGELFIVQARPETVQSRQGSRRPKDYRLRAGRRGSSPGSAWATPIATGKVCRLESAAQIERFEDRRRCW